MLCKLLSISSHSPKKLVLKLVSKCCDGFEQVSGGYLIIYSTAWVNQFEIKDMCIEFVFIHVSSLDNNFKIKLNLKVEEISRDCSPNLF